jgi:hypothetical protein
LTTSLILLLAALLRFYNLSGQSLWADEGNSVALARRGFIEIAQRTAFDIHPPFYYWLLKIWTFVFGDSEIGLRSLSVVLGLGVVYLTGILGTRLFNLRVGLIAAFIAALSPLQIYYSQEARMYMLLTFLSSLTFLVAFLIWHSRDRGPETTDRWYSWLKTPIGWIYMLTVTAGLYTHYAYLLILLAVNLVALIHFWQIKSQISNWLILQLIPLLLYLPWLPTAWRQVTTWPSERQTASLLSIFETISTTLLFGLSWPFNQEIIIAVGLALALLLTFNPLRERLTFNTLILWLWFLLPVALTVIIFTPAFLKFLLVAAPPLALLLALTAESITSPKARKRHVSHITHHAPRTALGYLTGGALLALLATGSVMSLYSYYTNPSYARDNYRAMAHFIKAIGGPEDAIILNAEGQQDVFNYYYDVDPVASAAPVYPLPRRRPLDEAATLAELQTIARQAHKIFAVYWAAQQADPNGLIENWLDTHLFKATDQWYGNVRLVSYASPRAETTLTLTPADYQLGEHIQLVGYALSPSQVTPGDILEVTLLWQTDAPLSSAENYTVFVQVLDQANHVVGQRDARPIFPTSDWPIGKPVIDRQGVFIEPGTPPGPHRLIVGLYDSQMRQRLPLLSPSSAQDKDFIELAQVEVVRPTTPLPLEAFQMQVPLNTPMFDVTLLGYDFYKLGHRSSAETPLHPGDPVQLVAYWTAHRPVKGLEDQLFIQVVTATGQATPLLVIHQPAGADYPIQEWRVGEIIRAQYNFFLENLPPGTYRLALTLSATEVSQQRVVALTKPFRVEP